MSVPMSRAQIISEVEKHSSQYSIFGLDDLARDCNEMSKSKGFISTDPVEKLALMHSELSEALEDLRDFPREEWDKRVKELVYDDQGKPVGFAFELADVVIRVLQLCGQKEIPIMKAIAVKMAYNRRRPRMHGRSL